MLKLTPKWNTLALCGTLALIGCNDEGCDSGDTSPTGSPAHTAAPTASAAAPTPTTTAGATLPEASPSEAQATTPDLTPPAPTQTFAQGTASQPPPTEPPDTPSVAPGTPTAQAPTHTHSPPPITPTAAPPTNLPPTNPPATLTADTTATPPPSTATPTSGGPTATAVTPTAEGTHPPTTPTAAGPTATPTPAEPTTTHPPTPAPRVVTVKVVNYQTGAPVETALVYDGDDAAGYTDNFGLVSFETDDIGPLVITASKGGYHFVTIEGTTSDSVRLPMRPIESFGYFSGDVDFSEMGNIGLGKLRLGLVTRSVLENPVSLDFNTIVASFRPVQLCEYSLQLPSNFVGAIDACDPITDYLVPGFTATYSTYTFAGDLPFTQAYSVLNDPEFYTNLGEVFQTFQTQLRTFSWDVGEVSMFSGEIVDGVDPLPEGRTNASTEVIQGAAPTGVDEDTPPLTFIMADMGDTGFLPIGLAGGAGTLSVYHAPSEGALEGKPIVAVSMAAAGGVGNPDAPYSATMATRAEGETQVTLPAYLPILYTRDHDVDSRSLSFDAIEGAKLYHTVVNFHRTAPDTQWDIYQIYSADQLDSDTPALPTAGEQIQTVLPEGIQGMPNLYDVHWQVSAYDPSTGEFDEFISLTGLGLEDAAALLSRMSRHYQYNIFR